MIHARDAQDALGLVSRKPLHIAHDVEVCNDDQLRQLSANDTDNIVFAGMGGMALSAQMVQKWLDTKRPFEIVRDYCLPAYAGQRTLCVLASYSGNTEETLAALDAARTCGAQIVVIGHGGKLLAAAREAGLAYAALPATGEPRYATWYTAKALAAVCDTAGLTSGKASAIASEAGWLKAQIEGWLPEVPTKQNLAKQIALELAGKSVVVYAGPALAAAARAWKVAINENAKQVAWCGEYPEFNHNEFTGWSEQPVTKPYAVIELRSHLEDQRVQWRFEASERLLSGRRPAPLVVVPDGESLLRQLLYVSSLGDFVSVYLALLNGVDPVSLPLVDKLKKELV